MKIIVTAIFFLVIPFLAYSQDSPSLTCVFNQFIGVSYDHPEESTKTDVHKSMRVVHGLTDSTTLDVDGSFSATNSTRWKLVSPVGFATWEITYIGDFGDLLTLRPVVDELGANKKELHGRYKAILVTSTAYSTSILVGTCIAE